MTKGEIETIKNIINRLQQENAGCTRTMRKDDDHCTDDGKKASGRAHVSRIYIDTWLISPLQALLPGEGRDIDLARYMSK